MADVEPKVCGDTVLGWVCERPPLHAGEHAQGEVHWTVPGGDQPTTVKGPSDLLERIQRVHASEPVSRDQIKAAIDAWGDTGFSMPLAEYLARHLNGEPLPGPVLRK